VSATAAYDPGKEIYFDQSGAHYLIFRCGLTLLLHQVDGQYSQSNRIYNVEIVFRNSDSSHDFILPDSTLNSMCCYRIVDVGAVSSQHYVRSSRICLQPIPVTLLSANVHIMIDGTETSKERQVVHYPITPAAFPDEEGPAEPLQHHASRYL
jgi:hypothetical protein